MSQGRITAQLAERAQRESARVMHWRFYINLALMLFDAAVYIAVTQLFLLRVTHDRDPYATRFGFQISIPVYVLCCALIWILCLRAVGVYHRHMLGDGYRLNPTLFKGTCVALVCLCALNYVLGATLKLSVVVWICVLTFLAAVIARFVVRFFLTRQRRKGLYMYPTVLVGSPEGIAQVLRMLGKRTQFNYRPIAVCPIRINDQTGELEADPDYELMRKHVHDSWGDTLPVMRYNDELASRIATMGGQTVMVTDILERFSDNLNTFALHMESMNLELALTTSAVDIAGHVTTIRSFQGTSIMTIVLPQFSSWSRFKKRVFDLIVSSIAIVVAAIPMLIVALLIKLEDGGPVFYKQERIGLQGEPFYIHKFRSMRVNADAHLKEVLEANGQEMGARYKLKHDPRITKIGNFIRKTSLDELPQFFDVFLGTMSVVGPRPQRDFEVEEYDSLYATRLLVKPGITGPWQVSGRNDLNEEESRQLDVSYVQDWSVLGDIIYIMRTVGIMLNPKGAY